jgi:cation diffusion facilitator family transporter
VRERPLPVYAAMAANALIAVSKFAAAALTGSSAMLSEGIHSVVDTGNQGLVLLGLRRSRRPPDEVHPFGYGKELYFWSLVVALLLFGVGGGMGCYEGIVHLRHPGPVRSPLPNYVVLAIAALSEGASWTVAVRALLRTRRDGESLLGAVRASKDPAVFVALLEDSAALAGIAVAALGVFWSHRLGDPRIDGAASIGIGVLLAGVAWLLARECRHLLLGESADAALRGEVERLVLASAPVREVRRLLTMQLAPDQVLVNVDVRFDPSISAREMALEVEALERRIQAAHPAIRHVFVEAVPEIGTPGRTLRGGGPGSAGRPR